MVPVIAASMHSASPLDSILTLSGTSLPRKPNAYAYAVFPRIKIISASAVFIKCFILFLSFRFYKSLHWYNSLYPRNIINAAFNSLFVLKASATLNMKSEIIIFLAKKSINWIIFIFIIIVGMQPIVDRCFYWFILKI